VPLSGKDMLNLYLKQGWVILRQKGSHLILGKGNDRETIPMHKELKKGLEKSLLKKLKLKGDKDK
jgi:predicted RNA binding protein YcfA (HicA-like mRNA interferase family)